MVPTSLSNALNASAIFRLIAFQISFKSDSGDPFQVPCVRLISAIRSKKTWHAQAFQNILSHIFARLGAGKHSLITAGLPPGIVTIDHPVGWPEFLI